MLDHVTVTKFVKFLKKNFVVDKSPNELKASYRWAINNNAKNQLQNLLRGSCAKSSIDEFNDFCENHQWYDANVKLRKLFAEYFSANEMDLPVAKWIVQAWGGINGNHEQRLSEYLKRYFSTNSEMEYPQQGIATYSKLLAFRHPDKFAIFDARVAASINAILIMTDGDRKPDRIFPLLPTQNGQVRNFNTQLQQMQIPPIDDFYQAYLNLLKQAAGVLDTENGLALLDVEMLLFGNAERLVEEAKLAI